MATKKKDKKITIQGRDMIEELGLEDLPEKEQAKLIGEMGKVLYDRVLLRLVEKLSDKEAEKVNDLLKKKEVEKAYKYIEKKIPNFAAILKREVKVFQEEMIKGVEGRLRK